MKTLIVATAIAAASISIAAPAQAYERWVYIENQGDSRIYSVQISDVGDGYYGPDLLGDRAIPVGNSYRVEPRRHRGYCRFDVKITFEDGSEVKRNGVDLCKAAKLVVNEYGSYVINA